MSFRHYIYGAAILFAHAGFSSLADTGEAWTCSKVIDGKRDDPVRFVVNGQFLFHGDGSSHSKILLEDDKLLISFSVLTSKVTRRPENSSPVEIEEPSILYFVMDKSRDRLFILSDLSAMTWSGDTPITMMDADLDTMDCTD